ncbi:MAG: hypothetical protein ACRC1J_04240 [Sandaracinobacteroides sp.]
MTAAALPSPPPPAARSGLALAVATGGPGKISLDHLLFRRR